VTLNVFFFLPFARLVVPFIRLGECVVGGENFLLTPNALWLAITGRATHAILFGLLHAVGIEIFLLYVQDFSSIQNVIVTIV
jgi:hypothetical protein